MAEPASPAADTWLPAPRLSSLVYRGSRDNSQSDKDWRPRPTAEDKVIERHFTTLNGVEDGLCWLTRQGPAERAHVVPHAENDCTRLILWLQMTEIVPMTTTERGKWKVSPENLLPLAHGVHKHLTDGPARRAILRPTREDLVSLVRVLEEGLRREEDQLLTSVWRPQWAEMVAAGWENRETFGTLSRSSYEYQLDVFDLLPWSMANWKDPVNFGPATRVPGDETFPIALQHSLGKIKAPLSILSVVAVAVSQMRHVSRAPGRLYKADFMDDLEIMSYIVNLLGSATPADFRRLRRPSVLPPLPHPPSPSSSERMREWPSRQQTRSSAAAPGLPEFSSSPPRGYREDLAPRLYGMERVQIAGQEASVSTEEGHDDGEGDGGPGSPKSRRTDRGGEGGRSSGGDSSESSSDLSSISMHSMSELQDAKDAMTVSSVEEPPLQELEQSVKAGDCYEPRPSSVAHWHEESRALDDRQDQLLDSVASSLAKELQSRSDHADSATAATPLFNFLMSDEPLDIAAKLQAIEERREALLEQWEEELQWLET